MRLKRYTYFLLFIFSLLVVRAQAQKTDTLVHVNGNVMTGEIKKLADGILIFKMDGMGTISVEVEKIQTLKSSKIMQVRTKDGELLFGNIDMSEDPGYINFGYGINKNELLVENIIEMVPIKSTFWLRLSGRFDFGFDYNKSTDMARLNSSGRIDYRRRKTNSSLYWSSYAALQNLSADTADLNEKMDINYDYKGLIKGPWLYVGRVGVNSNQEMGLNARLFFGAAIQNDLVYTSRHHLYVQLGVNANREYSSEGDVDVNQEGLVYAGYSIYKHSFPDISLNAYVGLYPNLKFNGRWRLDTNLDLNVELFYNFYIGFKIYNTFDSNPPTEQASKNDWGTAITIGYSFH